MFSPTSTFFSCGKISRQLCLTGITALVLSACGGSGGGSPSAGGSGPAAVSSTTTAVATTSTTSASTSSSTATTSSTAGSTTSSTSSVTSSTVSSVTTTTISSVTTGAGKGYFIYGVEDANDSTKYASLSLVAVGDFASKSVLTSTRSDYVDVIQTGTYDVTTKTLSNIHPSMAVVAQNNQWFRSDLTGNGSPQLAAFSAQAYGGTFGALCGGFRVIGGINLNLTSIVYETAGVDNNCTTGADNKRFALGVMSSGFVGASDVTAQISSPNSVAVLTDPTDTSQTPINTVAVNGKNLVRYTVAFNNPFGTPATNIATAANSIELEIENDHHPDGFFVKMDDNIYWYDRITNQLGNSLHTIPALSNLTSGACDATDCYFRETTFNADGTVASRILRLPWKGTSGAQTVIDNIPQAIEQVAVVGASVYMVLDNQGSLTLQTVPKTGGNLVQLDASTFFGQLATADKFIYYTKRADNAPTATYPTNMVAVALNTSTAAVTATNNATWSGYVLSSLASTGTGSVLRPDHLVLVSNISTDVAVGMGGATLQSYNAVTNQVDRALGTVAADIQSLEFFGFANRIIGLGTVAGVDSQTDVVGLDLSQGNSFVRITQTPEFEKVVGL